MKINLLKITKIHLIDDLGNVESATDDVATKENLLEHAKKFFGL